MYFSLISAFTLLAVLADFSKAVPVSTTVNQQIATRDAKPEAAAGGSLIDLDNLISIPIDVDLSSLCLGIAVCNPVSVVERSD